MENPPWPHALKRLRLRCVHGESRFSKPMATLPGRNDPALSLLAVPAHCLYPLIPTAVSHTQPLC